MTKHHSYKEMVRAFNQYPTMLQQINELINPHKNRILQVAQSALPESQFSAFKKLFLDEFGQKGLESELANLFMNESDSQHHMAGHGQEDIMQGRRCHHD